MSALLLEQLNDFATLYTFVIRGIGEHLENDQPEPKQIMSALLTLENNLYSIIREHEKDGN